MAFLTKFIGQVPYTQSASNYANIRIEKLTDTDFGLVWGEGQAPQWYQATNPWYSLFSKQYLNQTLISHELNFNGFESQFSIAALNGNLLLTYVQNMGGIRGVTLSQNSPPNILSNLIASPSNDHEPSIDFFRGGSLDGKGLITFVSERGGGFKPYAQLFDSTNGYQGSPIQLASPNWYNLNNYPQSTSDLLKTLSDSSLFVSGWNGQHTQQGSILILGDANGQGWVSSPLQIDSSAKSTVKSFSLAPWYTNSAGQRYADGVVIWTNDGEAYARCISVSENDKQIFFSSGLFHLSQNLNKVYEVSSSVNSGGNIGIVISSEVTETVQKINYFQCNGGKSFAGFDQHGTEKSAIVLATDTKLSNQFINLSISSDLVAYENSSGIKVLQIIDDPTIITINGTAKLGQTLTANHSLANAGGIDTISYQWQSDGVNINGAISPSFKLTQAHVGKAITVVASYTDGAGILEQITSNSVQVANFNTSSTENFTLITTISPSDTALGKAPKFALSGTDAHLFKISTKGALSFAAAPDYEQAIDSNKDGVYEVSVVMTNSKTGYMLTNDFGVFVEFAAIQGTANADTLKGTKGWDTLDGLAGNDKLTGDKGLDTFIISSGSDSITDFNNLGTAVGQEILQVSSGATVSATLKAAWTATSTSVNNGIANLFSSGSSIDLSAINRGQGWNLTNTGKSTTFTGSVFDDVLTGGTATDYLFGGVGNDVLNGGKGFDHLTGGTGADTFRFTGGSGITNADRITDFVSGVDKIQIDATLLKNETKGQLSDTKFTAAKAATNTTQHFVYDNTNGNLWYDADGSGTKVKAVLIGVLDNNAELTASDLWVV
jgi:Ca2+-binding RTX toxin-like protein